MQRHLLLKRQQQRHSFEQRLLRNQPLVEHIVQQQTLLPALLMPAVSEYTSEADMPIVVSWRFASDDLPSAEIHLPDEEVREFSSFQTGEGASEPALVAPSTPFGETISQHEPELPARRIVREPPPASLAVPGPRTEETPRLKPVSQVQPARLRIQELSAEHNSPVNAFSPADSWAEIESHTTVPADKPEPMSKRDEEQLETQQVSMLPTSRTSMRAARHEQSATATPAEKAEELFAPRGTDRSPQAWLARLTRKAQQEQEQTLTARQPVRQPEPARPAPRQPEQLSQRARAFLKPLVGIDPGEVPIYRDALAEQHTSQLHADALSTGETIEIAAEYSGNTPATLGLLAHELTHTARQQQLRFLPPVALQTFSPSEQTITPERMDEETLALKVEQQVLRQATRAASITNAPSLPSVSSSPGTSTTVPATDRSSDRGIWGNLPAPWEPLPAWLASPSASIDQQTQAQAPMAFAPSVFQTPMTTWQAPGTGSASSSHAPAFSSVRLASEDRNIDENDVTAPSPQNTSGQAGAQEPEQDLDALAHQVYTLLKRRLGVEQRRGL